MKIKLPVVALAALLFAGLPVAKSSAFVAVSVGIAPPVIPIYEQPYAPGLGYIWTPGYWDYADFGYYWVPGVWVRPPRVGLLWTPGYWGYRGGGYRFNSGYWGPTVGFYGGINYGFGYVGSGYYGGRWDGGVFRYNTAVTRVNTTIINNKYVYKNNVPAANRANNRAAFNGPGGAQAKPNARERAAMKAKHIPATATQRSLVESAKKDPALHAANNKGKPEANAVSKFRNQATKGQTANETAAASKPNAKNNGQPANANSKVKAARKAQAAESNTPALRNRAERSAKAKAQATDRSARKGRAERAAQAQPRKATREVGPRPAARAQSIANDHARFRRSEVVNRRNRPGVAARSQAAPHRAQALQRRPAVRQRQAAPAQQQKARKKKRAQQGQPDGQ